MSDTKSKQKTREWAAGWGIGLTGPTTPAVYPVCGGEDWPYTPVHCGMETIAICPDQEFEPGSGAKHARLIAAAPELLEALRKYMAAGFGNSTDFYAQGQAYDAAVEAIAKATGSES